MESCIEYNYLRNVCRDNLLAGSECESVSVVMNGSELTELIDLLDNFVCNEYGLIENVSTLYYTVTYSRDLIHAVDNLCVSCSESLNKLHESFCMCGEAAILIKSLSVESLVGDVAVDTDTVAVALCDNTLIIHVDELIFE